MFLDKLSSADRLQALATISAALEYYQDGDQGNPDSREELTHDMATCYGMTTSLDTRGITKLIEEFDREYHDPIGTCDVCGRTIPYGDALRVDCGEIVHFDCEYTHKRNCKYCHVDYK